jgi:hypothetical protein
MITSLTLHNTEWELDMLGLVGEQVKVDQERQPTEWGYRSFEVTVQTGRHAGFSFLAYIEELADVPALITNVVRRHERPAVKKAVAPKKSVAKKATPWVTNTKVSGYRWDAQLHQWVKMGGSNK